MEMCPPEACFTVAVEAQSHVSLHSRAPFEVRVVAECDLLSGLNFSDRVNGYCVLTQGSFRDFCIGHTRMIEARNQRVAAISIAQFAGPMEAVLGKYISEDKRRNFVVLFDLFELLSFAG